MAASRPMREDAGKERQRSFKFEQNSLIMMVFCIKTMVKTKCESNAETKQAEKQTKQMLKHNKTNWMCPLHF